MEELLIIDHQDKTFKSGRPALSLVDAAYKTALKWELKCNGYDLESNIFDETDSCGFCQYSMHTGQVTGFKTYGAINCKQCILAKIGQEERCWPKEFRGERFGTIALYFWLIYEMVLDGSIYDIIVDPLDEYYNSIRKPNATNKVDQ